MKNLTDAEYRKIRDQAYAEYEKIRVKAPAKHRKELVR